MSFVYFNFHMYIVGILFYKYADDDLWVLHPNASANELRYWNLQDLTTCTL